LSSDVKVAAVMVAAATAVGVSAEAAKEAAVLEVAATEAVGPEAVVLPPLPYGLSRHHMGFPGTITLSEETFLGCCVDVARSMKAHGVTHLLLVNGHNGNTTALAVALYTSATTASAAAAAVATAPITQAALAAGAPLVCAHRHVGTGVRHSHRASLDSRR
jgi:creatinine amidohydrolase